AVEHVGRLPVGHERLLHARGDRRLAGARQAGEPDGGAGDAEHRPALLARDAALVPGDVRARSFGQGQSPSIAVIIPAPTVSFVASSIRMKLPVVRLRRYSSTSSGALVRSATRPISLRLSPVAASSRWSVFTSIR